MGGVNSCPHHFSCPPRSLFSLPSPSLSTMLVFLHLCLLLTALSTFISSETTCSPTAPSVYSNRSGNNPVPLLTGAESTPFKPQIRINRLEINNNGTGWEEWLFIGQIRLTDGSEIVYDCKWALGYPTSADVSHQVFSGWTYFPNGSFYHQVVHDPFRGTPGRWLHVFDLRQSSHLGSHERTLEHFRQRRGLDHRNQYRKVSTSFHSFSSL